jgi:MiaB/RimO family radical SAM methylthiotransferase
LPELINEIVNLPGEYKIRLGMMNPFSIADIMPDMVEAIKHPRVYRFIHLPVQSGSDRILMLMGRPYTTKEYNSMIEYFRKNIPDITFSTDYIVGFPTETDDDFKMTMESLRINLPLKVNITRYSPRPGTKAEKMPDILERTKKERSRMLTGLHHNITSSFMKSSIGKHKNVLITEKGKDGSVIAKDDSYNMIVIREALSPGIRVNVEIIGSGVTYMIGKII